MLTMENGAHLNNFMSLMIQALWFQNTWSIHHVYFHFLHWNEGRDFFNASFTATQFYGVCCVCYIIVGTK
jgi:hypothetical protein